MRLIHSSYRLSAASTMTTQPTPALSGYQRSARSLGAKSTLSLAAGAAALLSASPLHAQAVAFHPTTGNVVSKYGILFIDSTTFTLSPTTGDIKFRSGYQYDAYSRVYPYSTTPGGRVAVTTVLGQYVAKNLSGSVLIDASSFDVPNANHGWFNGYNRSITPQWVNASGGYVGLKFFSSRDNAFHYGWLEVNTNVDASQITVVGFGYNLTPGASILTGQGTEYSSTPVPEPATSAALLALGAAGLAAYRQRKKLSRASA